MYFEQLIELFKNYNFTNKKLNLNGEFNKIKIYVFVNK